MYYSLEIFAYISYYLFVTLLCKDIHSFKEANSFFVTLKDLQTTVWKFLDFPTTDILCEINPSASKTTSFKTAVFVAFQLTKCFHVKSDWLENSQIFTLFPFFAAFLHYIKKCQMNGYFVSALSCTRSPTWIVHKTLLSSPVSLKFPNFSQREIYGHGWNELSKTLSVGRVLDFSSLIIAFLNRQNEIAMKSVCW